MAEDWARELLLADRQAYLEELREQRAGVENRIEDLEQKSLWLEFLTGKVLGGTWDHDGSEVEAVIARMEAQATYDSAAIDEAREALYGNDIASKWRWIRQYGGPNGQMLLQEITSAFVIFDGQCRRLQAVSEDEDRVSVDPDTVVAVRFDDDAD